MSPAAQLAVLITQRFVKNAPPDLATLCEVLGLRVREVPARGFDGALVRSRTAQKGIIAIKASLREKARKRFTIAHEIGHFVLPHHRLLKTVCDERKIDSFDVRLNRPEVEANEFASELVLPSAILARTFNLSIFSLSQISAVASSFETSLTATIRCFLRLTALPCAMIWSAENQTPWCARSDSFRFFLPLEELPAEGSHAAGLFAGTPAPPDFAPVPASAWLDEAAAERVGTLLEHSIYLPNYRAVLTLLWAQTVE
ncbi:MAG: ImmA/IrrE family metallo-endopeptidase [Acidobacteriia bacterium]|nr:ImmA/IrrE family metallo-endopeptidase [Terriglobia bacterium]